MRGLLQSGNCGDTAYALAAVESFGLTALSDETAAAFVLGEDDRVVVAAFNALPVVLTHLTAGELDALVQKACDLSDLSDSAPDALAAKAKACADRLARARFVNAQSHAGDVRLEAPLVQAAATAVGVLVPQLMTAKPRQSVLEAGSKLLGLQRTSVTALWKVDRRQAAAVQTRLSGGLTVEMLRGWGWEASDRLAQDLLSELVSVCTVGAALAVRVHGMEYPDYEREHGDAHVARNALRRLSVLAELGLRADLMPAVVATLKDSREREAAVSAKIEGRCTVAETAHLQAALDQRLLVLEEPARLAGGYVRRRNRGRTPGCPADLETQLLREQILQADLCVVLALRPLSSLAVRQLSGLLGSRSALVRAAAQDALARHPEETSQLRECLTRETDLGIQARLLEVLRCLGSRRSLSFARRALTSPHELLPAVALRYIEQFGTLDDLTPHQATLATSCGLVRLLALRTTMAMLAGTAASVVDLLADGLTALSTAHATAAEQELLSYPRDIAAPALTKCAAGDDALARVRAQRLLTMAEKGWPTRKLAPRGGATAPIAGDDVLGQTLMLSGNGPFEWGLPVLPAELPARVDEYDELLRHDEIIAAEWDEWFLTGVSPLDLLSHLQERFTAGGPEATAAVALALDIMGRGLEPYVVSFVHYHRLPVHDDLEQRMDRVFRETFARCTPDVVACLKVSNPSNNALFSEVLATSLRDELTGPVFCLAFGEMLKKALYDESSAVIGTAPSEVGSAFLRQVEREWDDLKRFPDDYYGFWVWPRLSLADMGRYCSTRGAKKGYRAEIGRYLGYLATSLPAFRSRIQEARTALIASVGNRLDAAVRSIVNEQKRAAKEDRRRDWEPVEKRIRGRLRQRLEEAIVAFDIHWLAPHPVFPLGTLSMAWEQLRPCYGRGTTLFPESHLSFANLLEKKITELVREERTERRDPLVVASTDEPRPDGDEPKELGQTIEVARDWEERRAERIAAVGTTGELADEAYAAAPSPAPPSEPQEIEIGGEIGDYYDLRQLAYYLKCHPDTLERADRANKIRLVRDRNGRRYLPAADRRRTEIALRTTSRWAKELSVSAQTIRNWMKKIPPGTDPLEMDRLLRERKKDTRGRKPQQKYSRRAP